MAATADPGAMARVRQWVLANFASSWFLLAPLLAAYAPGRLFQTYFNLFLRRHARRVLTVVNPYVSLDISERPVADSLYSRNRSTASRDCTFEEVKAYLSGACSQDALELRAEGAEEGDGLVVSMREGQDAADEFRGVTFLWSSMSEESLEGGGQQNSRRRQTQRLTFHKRHRQLVIDEYLPHVRRRGREILFANRRRRLYSNNKIPQYSCYDRDNAWSFVYFKHPTTFETLAMEPAKKKKIMDDLDAFQNNRDFYRRTGKPWKRGYLLYGPPGTGKSTMIAAMANHLNYDIYDIELTVVHTNDNLRKLLVQTTSKSIIVIEDIDCTLELTTGDREAKTKGQQPKKRSSKVTLSGLLNFIDGLWSACGGERIVVFTTNYAGRLNPALIRRGRMDMHIEMSYCGFEAFKTLAKNYLGVDAHPLFAAVEELLREVDITPADVAECLMTAKNAGSGEDASLEDLIEELKKKREEAKAAAEPSAAKTDNDQELEEGDDDPEDDEGEEDDEESEYSDESSDE